MTINSYVIDPLRNLFLNRVNHKKNNFNYQPETE